MSDISIIGGGHASGKLVNNLHKLEFKGNINIFSEEKHLPYEDRLYQKIICMDQKNLKILRLISI